MSDLCRCPDNCGLPVNGERWYAWKCPWRADDLIRKQVLKRQANERFRRKQGMKPQTNPARAKINQQTYDRHDRWLADDDPPEVIEATYQRELAKIKARRKAQAA
jgi:hypothetical protein